MMEPLVLFHGNAMPAPTWHGLGVNDTDIEIPAHLSPARSIQVAAPDSLRSDPDAFERMTNTAFETGMGFEAFRYLREAAGDALVLETKPGETVADAAVFVKGIDGAANVAAIDVIAAENSRMTLSVDLDSPVAGTGMVGCSLRVFAAAGAHVSITSTQTLDDSWVALDDTGLFLDEGAHVDVRHTVLGAGRSYTGLAGNLCGEASRATVDTRYLGSGERELDFNYILRHRGAETQSSMNATGVLTGSSSKTLRGTIDFVRGCKGASGEESETVLIAEEHTVNRSVPVILCGEDDVAGNHGATIGHIRPDQLFYLASRGLSDEDSERLFVRSMFEEAVLSAPTGTAQAGVLRLARATLGNLDLEEE